MFARISYAMLQIILSVGHLGKTNTRSPYMVKEMGCLYCIEKLDGIFDLRKVALRMS